MSYSNYGEPERDLSDQLAAISGIAICPHDLYASWPGRWKLEAGEKTALAEFLKKPEVILTEEEKKIVGEEMEALKKSRWWEMLWARSCDQFRKPDPRHDWWVAMQFHYAGDHPEEGWQTLLAGHYTAGAIRRLKEGESAGWATAEDKRVFPYLRAELMRRSGRTKEARALFQEVMRKESKAPDDDEMKWIGRWAEEQSLRIDAEAMSAEDLGAWLLPEFPDPWRDKGAEDLKGWGRHFVALDVLAERIGRRDKAAAEVLWKKLGRSSRHLLAALETLERDLSVLHELDPEWTAWIDELAEEIEAERLPEMGREERNPVRVFNVFSGLVSDRDREKQTKREAISRAVDDVKLPVEGWSGPDLMYELEDLLERRPEKLEVVGILMIRTMKTLGESDDDLGWASRWAVVELLKLEGRSDAWVAELPGDWKSSFWKTVGDYLAGVPGASAKLAGDPLAAKDFGGSDGKMLENFLWQIFTARKDPVWKEKATAALQSKNWLHDEIPAYALALGDPELGEVLTKRAARLRAGELGPDMEEMALYEIQAVETKTTRKKMARLPVR